MPRRRRLAPLLALVLLGAVSVGDATALSSDYPHTSHGNRGVNVKTLQHLLRAGGSTIAVDGVFGDATRSAVQRFQRRSTLVVTGAVDRSTWSRLVVPLASGATGEAVRALQRQLVEKRGADLDIDGTFGAATRAAVTAFQSHARLPMTGTVDRTMWRVLLAHLELPVWGKTLCDYSTGNGPANWGTASAIGQLQAAAHVVVGQGHGRVPLGDIGFEHGGDIPGHQTHEEGLDADLRPMRVARDQCRWGTNWRLSSYDRAATRDLVRAIRATAPGHVKLIYFNDPVLIREGLTTWFTGHDDHLHVRYCERVHPVKAYDC